MSTARGILVLSGLMFVGGRVAAQDPAGAVDRFWTALAEGDSATVGSVLVETPRLFEYDLALDEFTRMDWAGFPYEYFTLTWGFPDTEFEVSALEEVRSGSYLTRISDHPPYAEGSALPAEALGFEPFIGVAVETPRSPPDIFVRSNGSLSDHYITNRNVDTVATMTGHAFRIRSAATPLLTLVGSWEDDSAHRTSSARPCRCVDPLAMERASFRLGPGGPRADAPSPGLLS